MNGAKEPGPETIPSPQSGNGAEVDMKATITSPSKPEKVEKVIVAVHGIGDQYNFATIQSVVNQFCVYYGQPAGVPLGSFHGATGGYSIPEPYPRDPFERLAFAEVYWAPIARTVANEKYTLEEAKKWARTIVERLRLRWWAEGKKGNCNEADFRLTKQVLGEMIQTIAVVDRLCFLADKAGLFTFDLKKLLDNYLGDVQLVAEFKTEREKILQAFTDLLAKVEVAFPNADVYLVTHSEGTVVALLGLLEAFRRPEPPPWTRNVRGLMTLGSPIDKHLALWPELFGSGAPRTKPPKPIEWRNYYDLGDPVGFELDSFREWIEVNGWQDVFHFDGEEHDKGFSRYPFPGKAHVDYWTDEAVFGHFISEVVEAKPPAQVKPKPADLQGSWWLSYVLPYAGVMALLFVASYVLYKAVTGAMGFAGYPDAITGFRPEKLADSFIFKQVTGLAALLLGITVAARIPRLTRNLFLRGISLVIAAFASYVYLWSVQGGEERLVRGFSIPPGCITLGMAILVVSVSIWASRKFPSWGLTPLMAFGAIAVFALIASYLDDDVPGRTLGPIWPVLLATGAFLYLWWLAALIFDLVFIWHLYIRNSNLTTRVNEVLGSYKGRRPLASPQSERAVAAVVTR